MIFDNTETVMVDVRAHYEYLEQTLQGAISIPLGEIQEEIIKIISGSQITKDGYVCEKEYIVFCDTGKRSKAACIIFKKHGFKVFDGGSLI